MSATNSADTSLHAAFFMEGLRDRDYDAVLKAWDQGCLELVSAMIAYVPRLQRLIDAATSAREDSVSWPGVLTYEVSGPFGTWIADKVLETGAMPSEQECMQWLSVAVIEFFSQGEDQEHIRAITAAVAGELMATKH